MYTNYFQAVTALQLHTCIYSLQLNIFFQAQVIYVVDLFVPEVTYSHVRVRT